MAERSSDGQRHHALPAGVSDLAIVATDRDGRVTEWSASAEHVLGWSAAEMAGQSAACFFTPEDRAAGVPEVAMRTALADGRAADERWHLRADGSRFRGAYEVMPLRGGGGAHAGFVIILRDCTVEHGDRAALREAEAGLRRAQEAGGIGVFSIDIASGMLHPSPHFCRLYGLSICTETQAERVEELVVPEDAALISRAANRSSGLASTDVEYRIRRADDGALRWIARKGEFERDAAGRPVRFLGVARDITDQVATREALAAEREQLAAGQARQAALLALGDAIRDLADPADIAFAASAVLGQALGVSRVGYGVIDKVAETITIERDWNAPGIVTIAGMLRFRDFGSYIDDLNRGETVAIADAHADPRTRDTAAALAAISATAFVNMPVVEHGQSVALLYANHAEPRTWREADLLLMRDVAERVRAASERARADAALRASEEQFRVFAQAVPNQIWAATPDGRLYWLNRRAYAYSGDFVTPEDQRGNWGRLVHPDDLPAATAAWTNALATGRNYATEFRIRGADGGYRWFLVRAEPVRSPDGAIVRWVGTNTDIDDRRRQAAELAQLAATLEEQVAARTADLMQTEEKLRQSQKMEAVGQLTGGIAHDFNNLLTGISGSLELLGIRIAQGRLGDADRYIVAAQGAAKRAAALTHRLLAFSRRQTLDPKPTDANRLVAGMEDLIRRTIGDTLELEVIAAGGLWTTLIDSNQLENALLNLCINARDAMPDGGRITIETGNRWLDARAAKERDLDPGQYISLCVSDTGTGMTPEVIARAFDPFFTTKPLGLGTGLGLSMIYGFARQSGGQVRIYSEVGEGTMVCLYLPRHRDPAAMPEVAPELAEVPRAAAGETVLVVDDNPTVRMLVVEVLEELGYAAIEAADGAGGLRVLNSDARIDLLVTDVGLPGGMNGRQMADLARLARPDLAILFITGYAENAVVGNGQLGPGMHVMTKPFAMEALATRIRELIAGKLTK